MEGWVLGVLGVGVRLNGGEFGAKVRIGKRRHTGALGSGRWPNELRGCVAFSLPSYPGLAVCIACIVCIVYIVCIINTTNGQKLSQSRIAGRRSGDLQGRSQAWQAKAGFAGFAGIVHLVGGANGVDGGNKDIPSRIMGLTMGLIMGLILGLILGDDRMTLIVFFFNFRSLLTSFVLLPPHLCLRLLSCIFWLLPSIASAASIVKRTFD